LISSNHLRREGEAASALQGLWPMRNLGRQQARAASMLAALAAIAVIVLIFVGGLRRGMDHVTMFGPENEQAAIAIALSDVAYGLNAGYLGYATVHDKLVQIWNRGASSGHDPILIQNGANRELLNEAISAAASLGPQQRAYVGDRTLITMLLADIGSVDIYKIGFRLFGYKIESAYYTFFLILIVSTVTYLFVFWNDTLPKLILLCMLFAFYVEMHTPILTADMPTFFSERHGSALAFVPMWHFVFLFMYRYRASVAILFATVIQVTIMLLAIKIRGSTIWIVLFLVLLSIAISVLDWRRLAPETRTWQRLLRTTAQWPVVLLVGALLVNDQYVKASLHPVYFTDHVIPYHPLWLSAIAGVIGYSPELMPPHSKINEVYQTLGMDTAVYTAGMEYLNDVAFLRTAPDYPLTAPPTLLSPWTGTYKFRLMDESVRRAMMQLVRKHPLGVLQLYLSKKPYNIVTVMFGMIKQAPGWTWIWLLLFGGIGIFVMALLAGAPTSSTGRGALLPVAAMPFAALGPMWAAATTYTLLDLALITFVFLQLLLGATLLFLTRSLLVRWHQARN
jgi:hypothetical protein